jgi:hypothetical protein
MTIDYNALLTDEQKRSIVQQRIYQFAAEAYQHELNKKTFESLEDEAQIESSNTALTNLEAVIRIHQAELDSLPASE